MSDCDCDCEQMLIEELKKRTLNPTEMLNIMQFSNDAAGRAKLSRLIDRIGKTYPVYEPSNCNYRIADYGRN